MGGVHFELNPHGTGPACIYTFSGISKSSFPRPVIDVIHSSEYDDIKLSYPAHSLVYTGSK